jgi:hypothetical protein
MKRLMKNLFLLFLMAGLASVVLGGTIVDDDFNDGNIETNTTGIGTGFNFWDIGWSGNVTEANSLVKLNGPVHGGSRCSIASKEGAGIGSDTSRFEFRGVSFSVGNTSAGTTARDCVGVKEGNAAWDYDAGQPTGFWIQFENTSLLAADGAGGWNGTSVLFYESSANVRTALATWSFNTLNWYPGTQNLTPVLDITLDLDATGYALSIAGDTITLLSGSLSNSYAEAGITNELATGYATAYIQSENPGIDISIDSIIITIPEIARNPNPANGATGVGTNPTLSWEPGKYAAEHHVYFGDNLANVEAGTGGTDKGIVTEPNYVPMPLTYGTTYYWRVDEVNDACAPGLWPGDVWNFKVRPLTAYNPSPANEANNVDPNKDLTWSPGSKAEKHDVYLGTDRSKVTDANRDNQLGVLKSQGLSVTTFDPGTLRFDTTYYWRIDEVNDTPSLTIWKGDIWSFKTGGPRCIATEPDPNDLATDVPPNVVLTWKPGVYAAKHDVYFSDSEDAVNDANNSDPNGPGPEYVYKGQQNLDANSYGPLNLEFDRHTYYWRIDEVNTATSPSLWRGNVWSFTTADYTPVEDFESYVDLTALQAVWKKGTSRALVYLNTNATYLHGGDQSMQFLYRDGSSPWYSEAYADTATLPSGIGSNWSVAKLLTLYFYGQAANDFKEPMYVKLTDGSAHTAKVLYDGDPNDLKGASWHEWNIPLPDFTGVDMSNVTRITIGFGDGVSSPSVNSYIYFDDIRVYLPRCVFSARSADFAKADYYPFDYLGSGDCMINGQELEIMANTWLAEDDIIAPTTDPNIAGGLVAYYPLDEGSGTTTADASGNGNDGTFSASGLNWVLPGLMGNSAIDVNGAPGSRISIGTLDPVGPSGGFTLSIWARWAGAGQTSQGLIGKRDGWGSNDVLRFMFEVFGNNQLRLGSFANSAYSQANIMTMQRGRWAHIAATVNGNDVNNVTFYLNGQDVGTGTCTLGTNTTATMTIGNTQSATAWEGSIEAFNGELDEARIYNRALSPAEIAYLADTTPGDSSLHVPVPSFAELYEGEPEGSRIVNFKDFAYLANMWLEEQLWPR